MNYLFFDLECADGFHICSLGYVRTDESFAVLEKQDILVDPECPFQLQRKGQAPWIVLAYDENAFRSSPSFGKQYARFKEVLTASDTVLLGHSITSDLNFLEKACTRYNKPQFLLDVYDTQQMYMHYAQESNARALDYIVQELGIEAGHLSEHKSCDDAEMSMLVAKALCERLDCNLPELLTRFSDCLVTGRNIAIAKAWRECKKAYPKSRWFPAVYISETLRESDLNKRLFLIEMLYRRGYAFTRSLGKCRYFVAGDDDAADVRQFEEYVAAGKKMRKITTQELGQMLKTQVSERGEAEEPQEENCTVSLKNVFAAALQGKSEENKKKSG